MNYKRYIFCFLIFLSCCFSKILYCKTVGSNSSSSRQLEAFFSYADTNNKMVGFAVFEKGLILEDFTTTCVLDSFFPVSGYIVLNGGTLFLSRDAVFKSPLSVGSGKIDGDSFSLEFPTNVSSMCLPSLDTNKLISFCDEKVVGDNINDISWSYDDNYIAIVTDSFGGHELQIYYVQDMQLTLTASYDFGSYNVYAVDWHPSDYYLAVGTSGGDELYTFSYNAHTATLEVEDTANLGRVYDVEWSPDGTKLAVGRSNNNDLLVYNVQDGELSSVRTCTLYTAGSYKSVSVQKHGISWKSSGDYLVASFKVNTSGKIWEYAFKAFKLDEDDFIDDAYEQIGDYMYPISCKPNSDLISVGLYNSRERLRLYKHNKVEKAFTEIESARQGENRTVYDISWGPDNFVAFIKRIGSSNYELQVDLFDQIKNDFSIVSGHYTYGANLRSLGWSHNGQYIAIGGSADKLVLLSFMPSPLIFKDIKLFFKSDVVISGEIIFEGSCILNMGRNILEFAEDAKITVTNGAQLVIEDAKIKGVSNNDIACADDNGIITLKDVVWIQDGDYSFSKGALKFENDVLMSGDYTFAYQSLKTSTLLSRSNLYLDVGFTFSYDPNLVSKDLIQMIDKSSVLTLNGAMLHTTTTGMNLTNGRLRVLRDSFISSEKSVIYVDSKKKTLDEGITFGNGDSSCDLKCDILSGVSLHLLQGSLNYKNILASSWVMNNLTSVLYMHPETRLNLYQNLNLGKGSLFLENNVVIGRALGKDIIGSIRPQGLLLYTNI